MKLKHFLLLEGCLNALLLLFFIIMPFWVGVIDNFGVIFLIIMIPFFAYKTYKNFNAIKHTRDEDRAYAPPTDANVIEQLKFYKRFFYLTIVAFPLLTLIDIFELNGVESATEDHALVPAPIAFLYEHYGYWAAVLSVPVLGVIIVLLYLNKIRSINSLG